MNTPRVPMPRSITIAISGLYVSAALVVIVPSLGVASVGDSDALGARVVLAVFAFVFGAVPAIVATVALVRGRTWAPVGVTIAAAWCAYLLDAWDPVLSVLAMLAATCAIVAVWTPTAKQYGTEVRACRTSGLR